MDGMGGHGFSFAVVHMNCGGDPGGDRQRPRAARHLRHRRRRRRARRRHSRRWRGRWRGSGDCLCPAASAAAGAFSTLTRRSRPFAARCSAGPLACGSVAAVRPRRSSLGAWGGLGKAERRERLEAISRAGGPVSSAEGDRRRGRPDHGQRANRQPAPVGRRAARADARPRLARQEPEPAARCLTGDGAEDRRRPPSGPRPPGQRPARRRTRCRSGCASSAEKWASTPREG